MALAAPPDLSDTAVPVQPLARTYPRGLYIEPHEHVWGQVLYAMSGVMWLETPHEALVVPPRRWKAPCSPSKSGACCVRQHAENAGASVRTLARLFQAALGMGFAE
jgi:AraC-like DNA-binding protein